MRGTTARPGERPKGRAEVLGGAGGVRLELLSCGAQKPRHWRGVGVAGAGPCSLHAGVVLADLGGWGWGEVGGGEGRGLVEGVVVVDDVQQFENEYGNQGPPRGRAPLRVLQSAVDGSSAAGRDVVLEREGAVVVGELPKPDGGG